jgi:hypothetical protein
MKVRVISDFNGVLLLNSVAVLQTLQRQNTKISKEIFPEKEYRVSVPISTFMRL